MAFLKKSGRLGGAKSKVSSSGSTDSDLPADWMAQQSSAPSSSPQPTQDVAAARKRREEAEAEAEAERRRLLNVNRYAAGGGGGGGAAFTKMRKQEQSRLEKMQNQTFTRWVNLQLQQQQQQQQQTAGSSGTAGGAPMADLVQGLASGENLLRLLAVLSGKNTSASLPSGGEARKGGGLGGVSSRFQSLGNVEQAFKFMKEEGIPLIGIGPQDISQGNLKLILGMMWSIIQHYRLVNLFDEERQQQQQQQPPAQQPNRPTAAAATQSTSSESVAAKPRETREEQPLKSAKSDDDGAQKSDKADGVKDERPQTAGEAVSLPAADERAVEDKSDKVTKKAAKKDDKKKEKDSKKEKKLQAKEEKAAKKDTKKAKADPAAKQTEVAPSGAVVAEKTIGASGQPGAQPATKAVAAARQPQQSVESSLLEWVRDKLADAPEGEKLQVNNVKELFADGRALPVLVNTIQPGSVDVRALDVKKPIENNKLALRAATEKLAVPALIEGDDLANGADVDGLSLILYLSYLKQADARKVQTKEEEARHTKQETAPAGTNAVEPASVLTGGEKSKADGNVVEKELNETKSDETKTVKTESEASETKTTEGSHVIKNEEEEKSKAVADARTAEVAAATATAAPVVEESVAEPASEALAPSSAGGESKHTDDKRPSSSQGIPSSESPSAAAPTSEDQQREIKTSDETIASEPSNERPEQCEAITKRDDEKSKEEKKAKKDKKKDKKTKKSKKGKDASGEDGKKKKKNKKTKASSKAASAPAAESTEAPASNTASQDSAPSGAKEEVPAPVAKKAIAPLPHSRLPTRAGEDLSYLAGPSAGAPVRKAHTIQLAAIPERKKAVPTTVSADVDPVSAFWYSE